MDAIAVLRLEETPVGDLARISSGPSASLTGGLAEPTGARRQLTVMFCDLVGSTALSEKLDPEVLRSLLHSYRTLCGDVIARYDGFVARYVGDGILTYFGWPTALEEDAERVVTAPIWSMCSASPASLLNHRPWPPAFRWLTQALVIVVSDACSEFYRPEESDHAHIFSRRPGFGCLHRRVSVDEWFG